MIQLTIMSKPLVLWVTNYGFEQFKGPVANYQEDLKLFTLLSCILVEI